MRSRFLSGLAAATLSLAAVPAMAETLPVAGLYPAQTTDAIGIDVIIVEEFGGDDGKQLSFALSDRLASARSEEMPFFKVVSARDAGNGSTGVRRAFLEGYAELEYGEHAIDAYEETKCVERDDGKCVKRRTYIYDCWRATATLKPEVRLTRERGDLLYVRADERSTSTDYCENSTEPSMLEMGEKLIERLARDVRMDLAPVWKAQDFRLLEKRKGLDKQARRIFKEALRLTKHDPLGACTTFEQLRETHGDQLSVRFNLGLCAESEGDLDAAYRHYGRAKHTAGEHAYVEMAMDRLADRRTALSQVDDHYPPDWVLADIWGEQTEPAAAGDVAALPE